MKLGLVIKSTSSGEQELFHCNKDNSWAVHISDTRSIINSCVGFDGSGKYIVIVKMLSALGYLIGIIKARSGDGGRNGDNTTAWIHVPAKMQILGIELNYIIESIKRELSSDYGIDTGKLNALFSKDYEEKNIQFSAIEYIKANKDGKIGWCKYGSGVAYQLHEFLDAIAQKLYEKYSCICFTDTALGLSSITNSEPIEHKELNKPNTIDKLVDDKGFKPYLDGSPIEKAFEIPRGTKIKIVWKKEGYKDIPKEGASNEELSIKKGEQKYILKLDRFIIKDEKGKFLKDKAVISIYLNDKNSKPHSILSKNFEKCEIPIEKINTNLKIKVNVPDYKEETRSCLIKDNNEEFDIQLIEMEKNTQEYTLKPDKYNGLTKEAIITITTKSNDNNMPLIGYEADRGYLVYNPLMLKIKYFLLGVASIIAISLSWKTCSFIYNIWSGKFNKVEKSYSTEKQTEHTEQKQSESVKTNERQKDNKSNSEGNTENPEADTQTQSSEINNNSSKSENDKSNKQNSNINNITGKQNNNTQQKPSEGNKRGEEI